MKRLLLLSLMTLLLLGLSGCDDQSKQWELVQYEQYAQEAVFHYLRVRDSYIGETTMEEFESRPLNSAYYFAKPLKNEDVLKREQEYVGKRCAASVYEYNDFVDITETKYVDGRFVLDAYNDTIVLYPGEEYAVKERSYWRFTVSVSKDGIFF